MCISVWTKGCATISGKNLLTFLLDLLIASYLECNPSDYYVLAEYWYCSLPSDGKYFAFLLFGEFTRLLMVLKF